MPSVTFPRSSSPNLSEHVELLLIPTRCFYSKIDNPLNPLLQFLNAAQAWRRENFRPSIQTAPSRTNAEQPLPPAPHLHLHRPELKGVYRAILDSSSSGSSDVSSDEGNGEGDSMFSRTKRGPDGCGGAKGPPAALMRNKAAVSAARRAAERQRRRTMAAPDGTTVPGTHQGERPPRERLGRAVREALWLHLVETAGKEGGEGRSQHDQGVQVGSEEEEKEELQSRFR